MGDSVELRPCCCVVWVSWPTTYAHIRQGRVDREMGEGGGAHDTSNSSVENEVVGSGVESEVLSLVYCRAVNYMICHFIKEPASTLDSPFTCLVFFPQSLSHPFVLFSPYSS